MSRSFLALALAALTQAAVLYERDVTTVTITEAPPTPTVPEYFQVSPEIYDGTDL
jgi:hypothetical protein